jgi:hypothetical protein
MTGGALLSIRTLISATIFSYINQFIQNQYQNIVRQT